MIPVKWGARFWLAACVLFVGASAGEPEDDANSAQEPQMVPAERMVFQTPMQINLSQVADKSTWERYKKRFQLQNVPEFAQFHNEHLGRTVFVLKARMIEAKKRCTQKHAQDREITVDGNWWRPQEPPFCNCGNEHMELTRFENWHKFYSKREYIRSGPWFGHSEYDFRRWIYVFRLRAEEFKRCDSTTNEWPMELDASADEPIEKRVFASEG